jgi:CRISPR-associated protein Cas1
MTDRILDLSESAVALKVRHEQLLIEPPGGSPVTIPLADIAVVVASHPHIRYTQAVVSGLAEHGGVLVACNERCCPVAMMLPLDGHYVQAERFAQQAQMSLPTKKRLWKQIVQAKISAQSSVLRSLHGVDGGLEAMVSKVRSGDPQNREATAAQRYWPRVFGDPQFRRDREAGDQNRQLNYGYAVLRAIIARGIAAAGLHPSLGLHHSNRYNAFVLADDLMEPYRPLVDHSIAASIAEWGLEPKFDRTSKTDVLDGLLRRFSYDGESRTLFDWVQKLTSSLAQVCAGERRDLEIPLLRYSVVETPRKPVARETQSSASTRREGRG